jgi:peptide/nickel transport system substrate-binding protein
VRSTGRLAVVLVAVALTTSACPSSKLKVGPSQTPTRGRPGGAVVVAYPNEPATLNPFARTGDDPATHDLARMLMPSMYRITPEGKRELWLLASEPIETRGPPFSVTIELRSDAVWSDGTPITVDDLRFTWKAALKVTPVARQGYDRIERIVPLSKKRARIEFRSIFRRWRDLFSAGAGLLPKHALSDQKGLERLDSGWPVSGGPFVLKAWHPGLDMVFAPNPHAWFARPLLKQLRVVFVPDDIGALALLRKKAVQGLVTYQAPDWIRRAQSISGVVVSTDTGQTWVALVMNTEAAPLTDVRVRRAFADSIDRARLARGLLQAEGILLNAVPPASSTAFRDLGKLARSRSTLTAAGWTGSEIRQKAGQKLTFTLALADADSLGGVVARAIQYQSARAGFDVETIVLPQDDLFTRWFPTSRFEAALVTWRDPPDGAARAHFASTASGTPNLSRFGDGMLDAAFAAEDAAGGAPQAKSEKLLASGLPVLPMATLAVSIITSNGLRGARASAEADGPFWDAQDWSTG